MEITLNILGYKKCIDMCSYDEINGKRLAFPIFIAASSPDSSINRIRSAFSYSSIMTSV